MSASLFWLSLVLFFTSAGSGAFAADVPLDKSLGIADPADEIVVRFHEINSARCGKFCSTLDFFAHLAIRLEYRKGEVQRARPAILFLRDPAFLGTVPRGTVQKLGTEIRIRKDEIDASLNRQVGKDWVITDAALGIFFSHRSLGYRVQDGGFFNPASMQKFAGGVIGEGELRNDGRVRHGKKLTYASLKYSIAIDTAQRRAVNEAVDIFLRDLFEKVLKERDDQRPREKLHIVPSHRSEAIQDVEPFSRDLLTLGPDVLTLQ